MATKKAPAKSAKKATAKSGSARLSAVDAYIAKAQPFAQPILQHLRETMHEGAPGVTEAIKWSMPFFVYEGVILGNMAAFKAHCSLGLWGNGPELREAGVAQGGSMGSFGRITSLDELPPKKQLIGFVKQAAKKIAEGERTKAWSRPKVAKPESAVPEALAAALKKNKAAAKSFEAMAPGCRREYNDWISDAKREETRDKRVAQAVEWIAEGKSRNWKYEKC
jgi:uncharacterized protein YdeI (YjbR/CyaY-like superfamily)